MFLLFYLFTFLLFYLFTFSPFYLFTLRWGIICLRFGLDFPPVGISYLRFRADFTPVGFFCPGFSSDLTPVGISCPGIGSDLTPVGISCLGFSLDFTPVGYSVPGIQFRPYPGGVFRARNSVQALPRWGMVCPGCRAVGVTPAGACRQDTRCPLFLFFLFLNLILILPRTYYNVAFVCHLEKSF
jgi:hypothetical protein